MAERGLEAMGLSLEGRITRHDQDPAYTGHRRLCRLLVKGKARVSYSEHEAEGNTVMEPFFGRFKTENKACSPKRGTILGS